MVDDVVVQRLDAVLERLVTIENILPASKVSTR
jgi:hypothetical protein